MSESYSRWFNRLVFIPNVKSQIDVSFSRDKNGEEVIYLKEDFFKRGSLCWEQFKEADVELLVTIFKNLAPKP